jgi:hypothetical protein
MRYLSVALAFTLLTMVVSSVYADMKGKVTHLYVELNNVYFAIDTCNPGIYGPYYKIELESFPQSYLDRAHSVLLAAYLAGKSVRVGQTDNACPSGTTPLKAAWVMITER